MSDSSQSGSYHSRKFMRLYDTDGDGKATLEEIIADHNRMFGALDVDGDKNLSVKEVKRRGELLQNNQTTTLFDLLDANGDGHLTQDEVAAPTRRWFKRYDVNGDGAIQGSELPRKSWRKHSNRKHRQKR